MLGLSSFMTEQRTKEIGIRKVSGASVASIISLFAKDFSMLVVIANPIAWFVAYYAMNEWLSGFIYPWIEPIFGNPLLWIGIFVFALFSTLVFAIVTVMWQVIKTANLNPANTLKDE